MEKWYAWVLPFGCIERMCCACVHVCVSMETFDFILAFWSLDRTPVCRLPLTAYLYQNKGNVYRTIGHGHDSKSHEQKMDLWTVPARFWKPTITSDCFRGCCRCCYGNFLFSVFYALSNFFFVDVIGELNWAKSHTCFQCVGLGEESTILLL